jgi:hypothetical protein
VALGAVVVEAIGKVVEDVVEDTFWMIARTFVVEVGLEMVGGNAKENETSGIVNVIVNLTGVIDLIVAMMRDETIGIDRSNHGRRILFHPVQRLVFPPVQGVLRSRQRVH